MRPRGNRTEAAQQAAQQAHVDSVVKKRVAKLQRQFGADLQVLEAEHAAESARLRHTIAELLRVNKTLSEANDSLATDLDQLRKRYQAAERLHERGARLFGVLSGGKAWLPGNKRKQKE